MLDNTEWVRINKQCHTLTEDNRVVAVIWTGNDEEDGDDNLIWETEIEGEQFDVFTSLYSAKLAIQKEIAICEEALAKKAKAKKRTTKKKKVMAKATK